MPEENAKQSTETNDGGGEAGNSDDQNQNNGGGEENKDGDKNTEGGDGDGGEGSDGDGTDGKKEGGEEGDGTEDKNKPDGNDEPEVRKRKSVQDFIIERKQRKIDKMKAKEKEAEEEDDENNTDDGDDGVDPEDEKVIKKVSKKVFSEAISQAINPILENQAKQEDLTEIDKFISDNKDFALYKEKVIKLAGHSSRKEVPISSLFYEVAGPNLLKIGADRQIEAEDEAKNGNSGGGSVRTEEGGTVDYSSMSSDDFEKKKQEVRQKPRKD